MEQQLAPALEITRETPSASRRTLGTCSAAHAAHDGFTDLQNVLYPLLQAQFGLSYSAVGALKAVYSTAMAAGQIPSGALADRAGAVRILALGTAIAAAGFIIAGLGGSLVAVVAGLLLAGLGGSTQHPVASTLVAGAFSGRRSRTALGTYNFAGDLGKVALPAAFAFLATLLGWQHALLVVGAAGLLFAGTIPMVLAQTPREAHHDTAQAMRQQPLPVRFWLLFLVHVADNVVRAGFLVFMPFLLRDRGADIPTIGAALSLLFIGGAGGKLVFGWIGVHLGVVRTVVLTGLVTASLIAVLAFAPLPLAVSLVLLPVLGLTLNGTSSVLYGTVPEFVAPVARTHAFAVFYTGGAVPGVVAPLVLGVLADIAGVVAVLGTVAVIALAGIPLVLALRRHFAPG